MIEFLVGITTVLSNLKDFKKYVGEKKDQAYNAVEAIQRAANRTNAYFASDDFRPGYPNPELSDLWIQAAAAVRRLDQNLYGRLLEKSEFWANPKRWNDEMVREARIYISDIIEDSTQILQLKK